jgi:TniQ
VSRMCSEAPPDLWPLRPQPFAEEAFSGWLARISQAHGLPPWRFVRDSGAVCAPARMTSMYTQVMN